MGPRRPRSCFNIKHVFKKSLNNGILHYLLFCKINVTVFFLKKKPHTASGTGWLKWIGRVAFSTLTILRLNILGSVQKFCWMVVVFQNIATSYLLLAKRVGGQFPGIHRELSLSPNAQKRS